MENASGRDIYAQKYAENLATMTEWLRQSGAHKAQSVIELCRKFQFQPHSVLEVGAGTGAVISSLREQGLGEKHTALEYSADALAQLKMLHPDIETVQGDATALPRGGKYDLVVCSHVLEHLEAPEKALKSMVEQIDAPYYILEVPLEDLVLGRMRNKGEFRRNNPAGHVQFYHPASFRSLVEKELKIVGERIYCPVLSSEAVRIGSANSSALKQAAKLVTQRLLPQILQPIWKNCWYGHMAVIAQKR
jgi:SAM-dependent methyltransferase